MKMKSQLNDFISRLYKSLHVFIFILKSKTTPCLVCKQLTVVGKTWFRRIAAFLVLTQMENNNQKQTCALSVNS